MEQESPQNVQNWISIQDKKIAVRKGETIQQAVERINKANYMTASQESPVKLDLQTAPHYVMTANELRQSPMNARVGEEVRYDYGTKKGILITVDRSMVKILNESRTGYDYAHVSDVHKSEEFTVYGMWDAIPEYFRTWMLKTAKVGDVEKFIHKSWGQLPKELRAVLRDESLFTVKDTGGGSGEMHTTFRNDTHRDNYDVTSYDGAGETEHIVHRDKHADAKNPNHADLEGLSGNLRNPQEDKRREGRQFPDNEEQNNTFSAGEENIKEPYSVNITGGSSATQDYGTQLTDWRYGAPKPFRDQSQTLKKPVGKTLTRETVIDQIVKGLIDVRKPMGDYKDFDSCVRANSDKGDPHAYCGEIYWKTEGKDKADTGENSYNGENRALNTNPVEEDVHKAFGVPEITQPAYGVKYLSKDQAEKMFREKKKDG